MKVRVKAPFVDKDNNLKEFRVGEVLTWDDQERAKDCEARGLVEIIEGGEEPKKTTKRTKK